jgi:tetratricopeptide (TPR) repeat protein
MKGGLIHFFAVYLFFIVTSCGRENDVTKDAIRKLNLKRGDIALCGPAEKRFGTIQFKTSCSAATQNDFNLAIALLHSFEYDEAEKVFAKIIDKEPGCAMAYWGVAMCNYHQVWPSPPTPDELEKGHKAISIARHLTQKSKKETDYIDAMALFYKDWNTTDHRERSFNFRGAMEKMYKAYPGDKEVAIFYALILVGTADPTDKSYKDQKQAGDILAALYPEEPEHPGIVHYIIHTYDYPGLAAFALPAAQKYASIAPASAHAQHMPSHIFTRLGLWDESIRSNLSSVSAAKCYAENAKINGHWDEELHGLDYLVYAWLQKGENDSARQVMNYLDTIRRVYPINFKNAYAFAAIPSRYFLENKLWREAAGIKLHPDNFPWQKFPWQEAIVHFARLLGSAHLGNVDNAKTELQKLNDLQHALVMQKDPYKANQVMIQVKTGEAWTLFAEKKFTEAMKAMRTAADMEDKTEKSPVTPGEVLPAKELLADMLLQLNKPAEALKEYEENLKNHPNRFNSLYYAGLAAERTNNLVKAGNYYGQLLTIASVPRSDRIELKKASVYLSNRK